MFEQIDNLSRNDILNERIRNLLEILYTTYFDKADYDFRNQIDAYNLCTSYKLAQCLIDTIFELSIENQELLTKNIDLLIEKNKKTVT